MEIGHKNRGSKIILKISFVTWSSQTGHEKRSHTMSDSATNFTLYYNWHN